MRILLITYSFLEFYNANSIQSRKFFLELANRNIQITILTKKKKDNIEFRHKNLKIFEVFSFESRLFNKLTSILKIPEFNFMPDWNLFLWNPFVIIKLKLLLRRESFEIIHTIGSPSSTHLIPVFLKNNLGSKWVAQFYDPWVDNSYINLRFNWVKKLNLYLEKKVAKNADLVIHTNIYIDKKWDIRYGMNFIKNKLVLPLCIDNSMSNKIKLDRNITKGKIIISHIGNIYERRNLNSLILAIKKLIDSGNFKISDFSINLIGSLDYKISEEINSLSFRDLFNKISKVSYAESLIHIQNSSLLLLIEEENEESLFFPSKLTDYLVFKKPILGLVPKRCISRDILVANGHKCFDHFETENISKYLEDFINNPNSNLSTLNLNISNLHVENVVNLYLEKLKKI
jgi:glycosyltransferase involved in cell wall biosynthesis